MPAARSLALATAHRVVDRIHGDTTNRRPHSAPAFSTGFAELSQIVLAVANLTNSCTTVHVNLAHLTRTQAHCRVSAFASGKLCIRSGRAHELSALAGFHLDVVNQRTNRNAFQW